MSNENVLAVVVIAVLVGLYLVLRRVQFGRTAHELGKELDEATVVDGTLSCPRRRA